MPCSPYGATTDDQPPPRPMSKQQKLLPDDRPFARQVVEVPVADEMKESFLAYSLSVITDRKSVV